MKKAFLSLGSNMGDRKLNLARAIRYINVGVGQIIDLSGIYETAPWGFEAAESFYNLAVEIITDLEPGEMISRCLDVEKQLGRKRNLAGGYASRAIDIDILFYENIILSEPELTLPHPHLHNRRFVLEPLCEIAPDFVHPTLNLTIRELLKQCPDQGSVKQMGSLLFDV